MLAVRIGTRGGERKLTEHRMGGSLGVPVATAAVLPYIALQFKALAQAWTMVGGTVQVGFISR